MIFIIEAKLELIVVKVILHNSHKCPLMIHSINVAMLNLKISLKFFLQKAQWAQCTTSEYNRSWLLFFNKLFKDMTWAQA
jgi:SRSO17 transposase